MKNTNLNWKNKLLNELHEHLNELHEYNKTIISQYKENFESFLKKLKLDEYRKKYKNIKVFEADMDKNIQAIEAIYDIYWKRLISRDKSTNFPTFEVFYNKYYLTRTMKRRIILFNRKRIGLCHRCLLKGLRARIYRTWISILTQIQAAYCCAEVFGIENVRQSVSLDHMGIDIKILYKNKKIGIQIKKETERSEIKNRKPTKKESKEVSEIKEIHYKVITEKEILNPVYKKNGKKYKKGEFKPFAKDYGLDNPLDVSRPYLIRLNNGFTIFTTKYFLEIKDELDKELDFVSDI